MILDLDHLQHHVALLAEREPHFAAVVTQWGPPPHVTREPGFATLLHIILEQQVSLASAKAAFDKLLAAVDHRLTPANFLQFDDGRLKAFGFSRQKSRYGRILAQAVLDGTLNLTALPYLDDDTAGAALTQLTGIGPWTADVYLMMALRRPDIWPAGDLALKIALRDLWKLPQTPTTAEMHTLAAPWRPYRTAAAHLLWHHYLSEKKR